MKKLFSTAYSRTSFSITTLLLRVILGGLMISHGFNKIVHFAINSQNFTDPFHIGDAQTAALFLTGFMALLFIGPGRMSMDRMIGK